MKTQTLEILTPEKMAVKTVNAEFITIPGYSGELGILPGHMEVIALLSPGEVRVTAGGETEKYIIAAGFAEVSKETVRVFTTLAKRKT